MCAVGHKKAGTLGDTLAGTLAGTLGDSKVVADRHVVFTPRLPHDGYVLRNASTDKDKDLGFFFLSQSDIAGALC
jgi:hypothetical protein